MNSTTLTMSDIDFILESLKYTKLKFENYQGYPSQEYKQERIKTVIDLIAKVNEIKKELK
jgi:hypothetical protein